MKNGDKFLDTQFYLLNILSKYLTHERYFVFLDVDSGFLKFLLATDKPFLLRRANNL